MYFKRWMAENYPDGLCFVRKTNIMKVEKSLVVRKRGHVCKGSDDQPRDERGRWTSGGGDSAFDNSGKSQIENAFRKGVNSKSSKEIVDTIIEHHESLGEFTPTGMKNYLEKCGYDVKPLGSRSGLQGQKFEDGGGYRVTFGGDGYFQYHPEKGSHHGSKPYWKISNGERGKIRYDMDGKEF